MKQFFGCLTIGMTATIIALIAIYGIIGGGYYYDDHVRQLLALFVALGLLVVLAVLIRRYFRERL